MYMSTKASNLNAEQHSGSCTLIQDNEAVLYCPYATQNLIHAIWFSVGKGVLHKSPKQKVTTDKTLTHTLVMPLNVIL